MTTLIALLRGVNVIGNNKLPMKELAALLTGMGLRDVRTYIQSGNVVFRCNLKSKAALAAKISAAIEAQHGFAPHVLLLDAEELEKAMTENPFPEAVAEPRLLHLFFLDEAPQHPDLKGQEAIKVGRERFKLAGKVFYLNTPDGFGPSKLAGRVEKLLSRIKGVEFHKSPAPKPVGSANIFPNDCRPTTSCNFNPLRSNNRCHFLSVHSCCPTFASLV